MNSDQQGDLAGLLARAAAGDVAAFVAFYDHTSPITFRYALACRRGDRDAATDFTRLIYLEAWRTADQHPASGLSPLAWLIAAGHHHRFQHPPTTITEHAC
ncbi:hypothetical protein [Nocardioides sp. WS12]|uniref:hypothetical protein n=1 Tax=Nocardioides sp. WS12 TaxID=2486272 RepID=UPI0015FDBDEE|nr:hypothetical protein [Nocardioides sp. WS12]